ncbi:MAG: histidine--tRNA ligase [Aggregatilineales bacterium]
MSQITPRVPKGMRDFPPSVMLKREYVFDVIREVFHLYGFEPIQTPVMELNETLMGKYGEDAENLIYSAKHGRSSKDEISLRYDLTVPLSRFVAMYENDLNFPFKRYHIAPVFRGERPQRGRYREFYQCDADIVGIGSMAADAEVVSLAVTALRRLGFKQFEVKINHRKLLTAIGKYSGVPDEQLPDLYRSVDKFDKIGAAGVQKELEERGIAADVVTRMMELITSQKPGLENLDFLESVFGDMPEAGNSINELRDLAKNLMVAGVPQEFYAIDFTMVRGLGYYTGPIFETIITEPNLGSIMGGGRYDELIGLFRRESLPTTGISLGIERIIDLMDELDLYPAHIGGTVVDVFVTVFDEDTREDSLRVASTLREAGINTELYMEDKKLGKQFNLADKKGIPIVAVLGPDEITRGVVTLRRLKDGKELSVEQALMAKTVRELLS